MWFIQSVKGNWASHWQSQCADRTVQLQQHHHAGNWQKTQYEESFEILILEKEHIANNLRGAVLWSQKTSCITPIATPPNWCLIKNPKQLAHSTYVVQVVKMTRQTWSSIILWHIRQSSKPATQPPTIPKLESRTHSNSNARWEALRCPLLNRKESSSSSAQWMIDDDWW